MALFCYTLQQTKSYQQAAHEAGQSDYVPFTNTSLLVRASWHSLSCIKVNTNKDFNWGLALCCLLELQDQRWGCLLTLHHYTLRRYIYKLKSNYIYQFRNNYGKLNQTISLFSATGGHSLPLQNFPTAVCSSRVAAGTTRGSVLLSLIPSTLTHGCTCPPAFHPWASQRNQDPPASKYTLIYLICTLRTTSLKSGGSSTAENSTLAPGSIRNWVSLWVMQAVPPLWGVIYYKEITSGSRQSSWSFNPPRLHSAW